MEARAPFSREAERLEALASYGVLDTASSSAIDAVVRLASRICDVPIALVSLVDRDRQWFLAAVGLPGVKETPREVAFCAHAIQDVGLMQVRDAAEDSRFVDNPLVTGDPRIRFYAGMPLVDGGGHALGTLCVIDRTPRALTSFQTEALQDLATTLIALFEARRSANERLDALARSKRAASDLTLVLDAVPTLVGYTDRDVRSRFANKAYADAFGRKREDLDGLHMRDVVGDEVYDLNAPFVEAALGGELQRFGREVRAPDGRRIDFDVVYAPDWREGAVHGFVAALTDVTDLRKSLRDSERRNNLLELAEDIAEVGHWRIELSERRVFWSPHVYRIHGRDRETFQPTFDNGIEHYHPDDRPAVNDALLGAIERQEPFDFQLRLLRSDGTIRRVHCKGRSEVDAATHVTSAIFGVLQDITDREMQRERVERQARLVTTGTLAAGVGHEINNPLTYVAANVEFALDELRSIGGASPSGRMREIVDVLVEAREGAERIRKIVRGLRAFAREETISVPMDVHAALDVSVNMAMHEIRHRASLVMAPGAVDLVFADESRLSQIFVNLLVNAAHAFSTSDTARNRIVVSTRSAPNGRVAIEVADNGSGMTPEVLARIFDPFFTTKPVGQGTGLGLSICHNVVMSLGGEISCATVLGEGTTFRVSLPAAPNEPAEPGVARSSPAAAGRVLVIDDEEHVLRSLTRFLNADHEVVALSDAREATRRLLDRGEEFDVVFCDLMMPHVSGMDLYRQVYARNPSLAARFVFVSGGAVYDDVRAFLAEVPNERLEKPFSSQNLKGIARRFVDSARAMKPRAP